MKYIRTFKQLDKEDLSFAGGKGANLGEMVRAGLPVPAGFVVGAEGYFDFLEIEGLKVKISQLLATDLEDPDKLLKVSQQIKLEFEKRGIPEKISKEIISAYKKFKLQKVAVRSSATAEDLPQASFAGQQATFLNVKGEKELLDKIRLCWASLFTSRAIFYRAQHNFDHLKVGLAVIIQKMVESEVSGVMFTVDPVTGKKEIITIEAAFGLGELVVGGMLTPDQYLIAKSNLEILDKKIANQKYQLVEVKGKNKQIPVSAKFANEQKLPDEEIIKLAEYGKLLEKHYYFPQDVEWAKVGKELYILQTRPITTLTTINKTPKEKFGFANNLKLLFTGTAASPGIATGPVRILKSAKEIGKIKLGDILVTSMTNPDFVPAMKKAKGVVTNRGGRTSHAAIVSRELGIPAVVGTEIATKLLKDNQVVTVDGLRGKIYQGGVKTAGKVITPEKFEEPLIDKRIKTATKIYVNLAEPEIAQDIANLNVDGVGLLRAEFIIAQIGIHPKKAIVDKKEDDFIKKLADNLLVFAKAFNPRPVIYRATDFKTNEYRNLKGGEKFEPVEINPMIGFRGAVRFITQPEVFEMELAAIKKVYSAGFDNLKLMIPFVRTPKELEKVKSIVSKTHLTKQSGFELWMMVEVPSNVLLLEEFLKVGISGISIGSNDLTMLVLGVDRDNEHLSEVFTEMDPAVLTALKRVITTCQKLGIPCSICGQAPSVFEDLVKKLVVWGINSISVSPDAVDRVRQLVANTERELVLGKNGSLNSGFKVRSSELQFQIKS